MQLGQSLCSSMGLARLSRDSCGEECAVRGLAITMKERLLGLRFSGVGATLPVALPISRVSDDRVAEVRARVVHHALFPGPSNRDKPAGSSGIVNRQGPTVTRIHAIRLGCERPPQGVSGRAPRPAKQASAPILAHRQWDDRLDTQANVVKGQYVNDIPYFRP